MNKLLALLLFLIASCASAPVVAYSVLDGKGAVYTDGGTLVAFGDLRGEAGVFAKGSSFPLTVPLTVNEGEVYLYSDYLGVNETRSLSEPLPLWLHELIPGNHMSALEAALGHDLLFEPEADPPATPAPGS